MSLKCMDKAVVTKIKSVYPNVVFGPLSRALQLDADTKVDYNDEGLVRTSDPYDWEVNPRENENPKAAGPHGAHDFGSKRTSKNGVVAFPLIAIDRINNPFDFTGSANDPLIRRGWKAYMNGTAEMALPVLPMYQIDVISNSRYEVDEIWREISMYLYLNPNIPVIYSEGTENEFVEEYPLLILDTDNVTDVDTFTTNGIIYRQTITAQLQDAKLLFHKNRNLIEEIPIHVEPFNEDWIVKEDENE